MKLNAILLTLAVLTTAGTAYAASKVAPINTDKKGIALHGYDPVTYFEEDKPKAGSETFAYSFLGATWRFVSADNRKKFAEHHDMYLPQFGGYCAKAVSEDNIADVDPLAYKIVNGKLYLNYDAKIQKIWEKDIPGRTAKAESYWPGLHTAE